MLPAFLLGIERFCIGCRDEPQCLSSSHPLNFPPSLFQTIKDVDLQALDSLEYINLSRNLIREIMPGTFLGMGNLKGLDFSVNVVRKVSCREKKGSTRYLQSSAPPPFSEETSFFTDISLNNFKNTKQKGTRSNFF